MSPHESQARVTSVSSHPLHQFSKSNSNLITLLEGLGVEGDAHCGERVQHRSRMRADPSAPNLRQVHLIEAATLLQLQKQGFAVAPGSLGENIITAGINLLGLPRHSHLSIGPSAVIEITGLRNPCGQLDRFQQGLMQALLGRTASGEIELKAGVMGVVLKGGVVTSGDEIVLTLPVPPHKKLERV